MSHYTPRQPVKYGNLKILISVVAFILILILYVSEQVYIVSLETEINDLKKKNVQLTVSIIALQIKAADLSKGSRIKQIALEYLDMTFPDGAPAKLF